tara:strand:+ start:45 stop:563 length:519 start_codon:yes stop_codon:yes gene_type:complete
MDEIIQFIQTWWVLIFCIGLPSFTVLYLMARVPSSQKGESAEVLKLRMFFQNEENMFGNIFSGEGTTTLPRFFAGTYNAVLSTRFVISRSYNEERLQNIKNNYIKKLLENNVKRYSVIQIEEFLEVESGVIEKAETYFFGSNNVKQIRTFQRAYAYYNALLQVIEYEKTIGK